MIVLEVRLRNVSGIVVPTDIVPKKEAPPEPPAKGAAKAAPAKKGQCRSLLALPSLSLCTTPSLPLSLPTSYHSLDCSLARALQLRASVCVSSLAVVHRGHAAVCVSPFSLSHSLSHTISLTLSPPLPLFVPPSLPLSLSLSLSQSLSLSHSLTHTLSHTLSPLTHTLSLRCISPVR
jgi:hypothetical protein